eukprot:2859233-Rhodomonas_salina.1
MLFGTYQARHDEGGRREEVGRRKKGGGRREGAAPDQRRCRLGVLLSGPLREGAWPRRRRRA